MLFLLQASGTANNMPFCYVSFLCFAPLCSFSCCMLFRDATMQQHAFFLLFALAVVPEQHPDAVPEQQHSPFSHFLLHYFLISWSVLALSPPIPELPETRLCLSCSGMHPMHPFNFYSS
jgi:hypothetical protein